MPLDSPDRPKRTVTTRYLRFPLADWPSVSRGHKRQYRLPTNIQIPETPIPVVGYAAGRNPDYKLLVIESCRSEPLGAISPADVASEGFGSYAEFKIYWRRRYPKLGFRALDRVNVLAIRPFTEMDRIELGEVLLQRLYGPFLPRS